MGDDYYKRYTTASADDIQRVVRRYLAEEAAAAIIYRPESAPLVAQGAADMKRILGEGGSMRLPVVPARSAAPTPPAKPAELEKEEAGVSVFRTARDVPVLVRRKSGAPMASIGVFIVGGAI